jgi:His/Glu/Gln/Arg/opine family amino acid ABC transporter permease subunit
MSFDVGFMLRSFAILAEGLTTTLALALPAILLAAAWGVVVVSGLLSKRRPLQLVARSYVELVRNTPVLVQMFFIYFGSGVLGYPLSGFTAGLSALVLQNGAYAAEIYRGGIQSVSQRQAEAGMALGLMPGAAFRIIVLPQALRKVIPPLSNQGVLIIKDTSLVATISVAELTFQARLLADRTAAVFEIFLALALFYMVLTMLFSLLMRLMEVRLRIRQ